MVITYTPDEEWVRFRGTCWNKEYGWHMDFDEDNNQVCNPAEGVYLTVPTRWVRDDSFAPIDAILEWIELDHHAEVRIIDLSERRGDPFVTFYWTGNQRWFVSFTIDGIEYLV